MRKRKTLGVLFVVLGLLLVAVPPVSAGPTDVIKEFLIDVKPQTDGSLLIDYTINWCVLTNELGDLTYIYVGVPNRDYTIESYSGEFVTGAQTRNTGSESTVQLNLSKAFRAGDCFTAQFGISQRQMANKKEAEVSFQFIPGWFDDIAVEKMRITWHLPEDESLVHLIEPEPTIENHLAVWETSLQPGKKFTVNLLYAEEVFPDLKETAAPAPSTTSAEGGGGLDWFWISVIVVGAFVVLIVAFIIWTAIDDGGYDDGSYVGGYTGSSRSRSSYSGGLGSSSSTWKSSSSSRSSSRPTSSPSRSSGGSGSFGGRGSSCACVASSCACACACAGGGRAGCSRKGFDISSLLQRHVL